MGRTRRLEVNTARGERFRDACRALFPGQPRVQVGERLGGVSGGTVRNWEIGQAPSPEALSCLEEFGVSLEWLLEGRGEMMAPAPAAKKKAPAGSGAGAAQDKAAVSPFATMEPKLLARVIGANLKHLRRQRFPRWGGQKRFAEFLGLSANDLCVYEYGRAVPNEYRLAAIAERLDMTPEELCRPLEGVAVPEAAAEPPASPQETVPADGGEVEALRREIARLEGKLEMLAEQNAAQAERIERLQEADYALRHILYLDDSPDARERRGRLMERLDPTIRELVRKRDIF